MTGTPPPVPGYGDSPSSSGGSTTAGSSGPLGSITGAQRAVLNAQGAGDAAPSVSAAGQAAAASEIGKATKPAAAKAPASGGYVPNATTEPNQQTTTSNTNTTSSAQTSSTLNTTSNTSYISYLDPASIQGAMADSWMKKVGRYPTSAEMQAFLQTVYSYEDQANTGTFETGIILKTGQRFDTATNKVVDEKTGKPVADSEIIRSNASTSTSTGTTDSTTNKVSQRGLGAAGLGFLADQSAMQSPEEGTYQAATTYFNAFMSALRGPAAGMN